MDDTPATRAARVHATPRQIIPATPVAQARHSLADDDPLGDVMPGQAIEAYPERGNLFRLTLSPLPTQLYMRRVERGGKPREEISFVPTPEAVEVVPTVKNVKRALHATLMERVERSCFQVSKRNPGRPLIAVPSTSYAPSLTSGVAHGGTPPFEVYPAYETTIMRFGSDYYLCIEHHLHVRTVLSLARIQQRDRSFTPDVSQRVVVKYDGLWQAGRYAGRDGEEYRVVLSDATSAEVRTTTSEIIPELTRMQTLRLAPALGISAEELERKVKQLSFLTVPNAPHARLEACSEFARQLASNVFPIRAGDVTLNLDPVPATLRPPNFILGKELVEPYVAFDHVDRSKRSQNILMGLTRFGAYDKPASALRVLLVGTANQAARLDALVERLNVGSVRYPGARKTFGASVVVRQRLLCATVQEYEDRLIEFVRGAERHEVDIALVYLPKVGDIDDPRHPYYKVKGLLVREGIPSQMVDEATVRNPEWRDLNLALNMFAKAGHAPWVLDEAISGVDLFIGLSSSQITRNGVVVRMMGYVNVFDSYGRWQFYQGDSQAFAFEERLQHYSELVKKSVATYRAQNGGTLRTVHIHLTKAFSAEEREVLARAVRASAPDCSVVFVWVNEYHPLRMYDLSPNQGGQIARATYLEDGATRLYLATTGRNIFDQKGMGTPIPLQLTVWADPPDALPSHAELAQQVLSLTRLNWASSRNFCQEPITTKYAGEIAKFMRAFMEDPSFAVHPGLRDTPWFL